MSKSLLVAKREYMENLRTKAFWIGIMALPVILVLAILVQTWMAKKKDIREYAVLDRSGELRLLEKIEKRAALPDLRRIVEYAVDKYKNSEKDPGDFEKLPEFLQAGAKVWAEKGENWITRTEASLAQLPLEMQYILWEDSESIDKAAHENPIMRNMLGEDKLRMLSEGLSVLRNIKAWWKDLPPKEAKKIGSGLSRSRYARKDVDLSVSDPEAELKRMISENELFAYFVIGEDPIGKPTKPETGHSSASENEEKESSKENSDACKYVSNNLTDQELKNWFSRHANAVIRAERLERTKLTKEEAQWLSERVNFESKKVSEEGEEKEVAKEDLWLKWAPVAFVYLLWISVFTITQMLLTNTIEEKSNKIMEVLLSSVSPIQLMAGKIIGIACTGLTMVLTWVIFFLIAVKYLPVLLNADPDIDLTILIHNPVYLSSFVAYFILGYLLLSAILVGIGSVCNSLKEAQNLMAPVTIILIVPLLAMVPIGQDPNGTIAKLLSYIPPFTPLRDDEPGRRPADHHGVRDHHRALARIHRGRPLGRGQGVSGGDPDDRKTPSSTRDTCGGYGCPSGTFPFGRIRNRNGVSSVTRIGREPL